MEITHLFIDPIDTLFLRGNKLFGDPGSFGDALVPPWPSVAAGALRSALLAHRGYDPARFAHGDITDDTELGTPERPGSFRITGFQMARRVPDGTVEPLYGLPADLSVVRRAAENGCDDCEVRRVEPHAPPQRIQASAATRSLAVLSEPRRGKPLSGRWLTAEGWRQYLQGRKPCRTQLVPSNDLWRLDTRIGIALDPRKRRASDGALFTSQGVVLRKREHDRNANIVTSRREEAGAVIGKQEPDRNGGEPESGPGWNVGFLAGVSGATLPDTLMLRFGGDGRAAVATRVDVSAPEVDYDGIAAARGCRLILTTPGLFEGGWKPTGVIGDGRDLRFDLHGVRARIVCAAVPRSEVISGFDLSKRRPKPAQRVAPAGSVYWLDELDATPDALRNLAARGLWSEPVENASRRAEGFNRITFGMY